jgi:hypothetical protein
MRPRLLDHHLGATVAIEGTVHTTTRGVLDRLVHHVPVTQQHRLGTG